VGCFRDAIERLFIGAARTAYSNALPFVVGNHTGAIEGRVLVEGLLRTNVDIEVGQ
jgi:hypothetical protein